MLVQNQSLGLLATVRDLREFCQKALVHWPLGHVTNISLNNLKDSEQLLYNYYYYEKDRDQWAKEK